MLQEDSPARSGARILLIDDDVRTARRFASMLEEDGFVVEVLENGVDAIERLARTPRPDAIVTDFVMPRAGGMAVYSAARRRWPEIPVLFVTGHPDLIPRQDPASERPAVVFTKPISYADFSAQLTALLLPALPH